MSSTVRAILSVFLLAVLVGAPWAYFEHREATIRNLRVVEEGVLYRSGQLSPKGFARVIHDYGIRTVVCLREGDQDVDVAEEKYCKRWGINHVRIPPRAWGASNGPAPVEQGLAAFREVMSDPANHPVLIHCFAGLHRTGAYCAVYRMDYNGWSNKQAIAEMRTIGYRTLDGDRDLHRFLENYEAAEQEVVRPVSRHKR